LELTSWFKTSNILSNLCLVLTSRSSHHYVLFKELSSPSLNLSGFGQPVYITKLLAFCQPLFLSFFQKYFPRPTLQLEADHLFQGALQLYYFLSFSSTVFFAF